MPAPLFLKINCIIHLMSLKRKIFFLLILCVSALLVSYILGWRPQFPYTNENDMRDIRATDLYTNVFVGEVIEETGKAKVNIILGSREREVDAYDYRVNVQKNIVGWV